MVELRASIYSEFKYHYYPNIEKALKSEGDNFQILCCYSEALCLYRYSESFLYKEIEDIMYTYQIGELIVW